MSRDRNKKHKTTTDAVVGVYAPYRHEEVTYAACSLCDILRQLGVNLTYFSAQTKEQSVCVRWDHAVTDEQNLRTWAAGCDFIIWWQPHHLLLQRIKEQKSNKRLQNIAILQAHTLTAAEEKHLQDFDHVVAVSESQFDLLKRRRYSFCMKSSLCSWDAMLPLQQASKRRKQVGEDFQLLVCFQNDTGQEQANTLATLFLLCEQYARLNLTITHTKNFHKDTFNQLKQLTRTFPDRVTVLEKPATRSRVLLYQKHDAMLLCQRKSDSGLLCLEAVSQRLPVVAWDSAPFREIVTNEVNGLLMACEEECSWLAVRSPKLRYDSIRQAVDRLLSDVRLNDRFRNCSWSASEIRRRGFVEYWRRLLFETPAMLY